VSPRRNQKISYGTTADDGGALLRRTAEQRLELVPMQQPHRWLLHLPVPSVGAWLMAG